MEEKSEKYVGPVVRGLDREMAETIADAIEIDNPGSEVIYEDHGGYIRIHTIGYCRLTRVTLSELLDRPFDLSELDKCFGAFAGRVKHIGDDEVIWYLEGEMKTN